MQDLELSSQNHSELAFVQLSGLQGLQAFLDEETQTRDGW